MTDDSILTVALLHDTLEDTDTKVEELRERFGADVARSVQALTLDKRRSFDEQASEYFAGIISAGPGIVAVKLADITDNLEDTPGLQRERLRRMLAKARAFLVSYKSAAESRQNERIHQELEADLTNALNRNERSLGGPIMIENTKLLYSARIGSLIEAAANAVPAATGERCFAASALSASGRVFVTPGGSCPAKRDNDAVRGAVREAEENAERDLVAVALVASDQIREVAHLSIEARQFLQKPTYHNRPRFTCRPR